MNEPNPFERDEIAAEWIRSVEGEQGLIRDNEIYPKLLHWSEELQDGALVIEIGSGQGVCSSKISSRVNYIGIDPSIPLTLRAIENYGNSRNQSFRIGNAYSLPIEDDTADGVLSVNVWFHLQNLNQAAYELNRILKPEGIFLIITANPESYETFWEQQYTGEKRNGNMIIGKVNVPINPLSENTLFLHKIDELKESFSRQNLTIKRISPVGDIGGKRIFICIEGTKK